MALRFALLIATSLLLFGCVRAEPAAGRRENCGSCHASHYADVGTCAECHRGEPMATRKELAHARLIGGRAAEHGITRGEAVSEGRQLVEAAGCRRCHMIGGIGNRLATNLDRVVWGREQRELRTSITEPVENMPAFGFDSNQSDALIAFLLSSARPDAAEETYRVHFARDASRAPTTFSEKCGGCHRLLTPLGPEGVGDQGPNLSGLFTAFYPKTAPDDLAWSDKTLAAWVANPRAIRKGAIMPPVPLGPVELQRVTESIRGPAPLLDPAH